MLLPPSEFQPKLVPNALPTVPPSLSLPFQYIGSLTPQISSQLASDSDREVSSLILRWCMESQQSYLRSLAVFCQPRPASSDFELPN
ncbi:hypothetical protein ACPOL_2020 [Acidisarcina polymorpha]|uniref:Uncharacterized protein n=1 Tax=Acidisarcina polymorpha TaxID=2211140 RepID=A0A2Z5FYA7_9BACT|nr:hypothetical protein ACPOL_2020 [Acidisarcina polymorpha]